MTGISMSSTISAGIDRATASSACCPFIAVRVAYPASWSRSSITSTMSSSSSTTSTSLQGVTRAPPHRRADGSSSCARSRWLPRSGIRRAPGRSSAPPNARCRCRRTRRRPARPDRARGGAGSGRRPRPDRLRGGRAASGTNPRATARLASYSRFRMARAMRSGSACSDGEPVTSVWTLCRYDQTFSPEMCSMSGRSSISLGAAPALARAPAPGSAGSGPGGPFDRTGG